MLVIRAEIHKMLVRTANREEDPDQTASSELGLCCLFLFLNKMLVIMARIHKILVRTANRENPDQTASLEAV